MGQDEADGYYATKSNWAFARVPYDYLRTCLGDLAYAAMDPTAASIMVTTITVTAHRDPLPA